MPSTFFKTFPTRVFDNKTLTNLSIRVNYIKSNLIKNSLYYDYTIKDGEKPDIISNRYYGDPGYDWVILLVNDIYDIYTQWPLSSNQLDDYIIDKYGSLQSAYSTVKHYEDNLGNIIDQMTFNSIDNGILVSMYDYEFKLNEEKRKIIMVDASYINQITQELKQITSTT